MSFQNLEYLLPALILIILYGIFIFRTNKRFFNWVEDHWFFKRSKTSFLSMGLYILGISLIILALLDLRGPEKRLKGNVVEQKTIILVDSSASMLVEDVRPNRFKKALLLVKHYIKKAVGQQISLVVFSDNQKRIVPFTEDVDLINARLDRLETLELNRGGTALSQAIQESIQYFKNSSDSIVGNILIFTDAEETELNFDVNIPDTITVGLIGIGTAKGGPIPQRNRDGSFRGNKKFQGEVVISKLDESYIKAFSSKVKNFKYWIATSYSLPTEEILNFFNRMNEIKQSEDEFRIRPVMTHYLLIPGILILSLSTILKYFRVLIPLGLLLITTQGFAQTEKPKEEKEPEKSAKTLELEVEFAKNELSHKGKMSLAYNLLKDGFTKESEILYEEVIDEKYDNENLQDHFNYALAKVKNKKHQEGINRYKDLLEHINQYQENKELLEFKTAIKKNVLLALQEQQGKGKGKSKDQQKNEQKNDEQNQNSDNNQSQGNDKNKNSQSKNDQQQDQNKQQNQGEQNKQNQNKQKNQSKNNKKVSKKKMPAILKQLISDDNQLQKKVIDAKTVERKSRDQKDW